MSDTPADRLKKLRTKRGFQTATDAAVAFGWNVVTYRAHENGGRKISVEVAKRYAVAFGSSPGYILKVSGGADLPIVNHVTKAPVVARAAAGNFRYDEGVEEGAEAVPTVPRGDIPASAQYAVIVDGPSVNKRIPDGAFAICALFDSYPGGAQHGQLVHVVRERAGLHEHTIKELRFTREGMILMPVSSDPKHQEPVKLSTGDDGEIVRIQGVVIGIFQPV